MVSRDTIGEGSNATLTTGEGAPLLPKRTDDEISAKPEKSQTMVLVALMLSMTLCGWNAGSLGPLLPALQNYYRVSYSQISLIFVSNSVGALLAGTSNVFITDLIGYRFTAPLGALCHVLAYSILAQGLPYHFFLIGIIIGGFALSLQDAQVNNIGIRLRNGPTKLSVVQACFSVGGTIAPFFATPFAERVGDKPYLYFYISMGVAVCALGVMLLAFVRGGIEDIIGGGVGAGKGAKGYQAVERGGDELDEGSSSASRREQEEGEDSWGKMKRMLSNPLILSLMMWSFFYAGAESSVSGYLTTFLIHDRGAPISAGYATMGFWIGMSVGRIVMVPVTEKTGYRLAGLIYSMIAGGAAGLVWITPSIIADSIGFCAIGFMFGPLYPTALMIISQSVDDDLRVGAMGLMGSLGGIGAAFWPFVVGVLSDRFGIWTLQPVTIGLIGVFILVWLRVTWSS